MVHFTLIWPIAFSNRNHNFQIYKAPLESQAQGTRLFTSTSSSQRGCPRVPVVQGGLSLVTIGSAGLVGLLAYCQIVVLCCVNTDGKSEIK